MAGVFCAFDPESSLPDDRVLRAHHEMDYRGADGETVLDLDDAFVGHHHFRTTPQEAADGQPISRNGVHLALDGRVDNRPDLLANLPDSKAGSDSSDAELLLDAYETYGDDFVERVVGVFALVIYDGRNERVTFARDRVGVRELYYTRYRGAVVVASDRTPLLTCRGEDVRINERTVAEYVEDATFTPRLTVYDDVFEVPPGHYGVVADGEVTLQNYWRPTESRLSGSPEEIEAKLLAAIRTAVKARLRSRGPVGTELSGGLDSTTVTALARRLSEGDHRTSAYSLVFEDVGGEELNEGERSRMAAVASAYDLDHHEIVADDRWPLGGNPVYEPYLLEGPCVNGMANAFQALYRRAADTGRRVLLTGEGGHLFDGRQTVYVDLLRVGKLRTSARLLAADDSSNWRLAWFVLLKLYRTLGGRFPDSREFGLDPLLSGRLQASAESVGYDWPEHPQARYDLLHTQDIDRLTFHSPYLDLLGFDRRVALAAGVDLRHPLLDSRVVDLLYSVPKELLIRDGRLKSLLRRVSSGLLPSSVTGADLTPSFTPLIVRGLTENREWMDSRFEGGELVRRGLVTRETLDSTVESFFRTAPGAGDYGNWTGLTHQDVWRLLTTEEWLRAVRRAGDDA